MAFKPIEILINAKDNASAVFGSLQTKVVAVGAAIATYFGINAFVGVVKGAADLETALSRVQAATGASAEEMAALRAAAEDAGATTKFTSTEAAGALENLAKAGLNSKDAIATLPAVLALAQAGDIELATASEYVTKAVMGMGLAFTDAGRVADVLAKGANATNTSVEGLAQALSYAAPVANSLGLSLETTVAIIGKFADAGIDASRAGTALNSILSQFADPASKFRNELAAAGITTNNFEKALYELAAAGPAGSKAILAVGTEAGPALRALLNQGIGALGDLTTQLNNAQGSAAATAEVMQNNLNGSIDGLSSAWDTLKNALGTPVLPVLKEGVDQLAGALRSAVDDGTVSKFGEAIAAAFQAGIKWVREFVGQVDFTQLAADMRAFADRAGEIFSSIGESARSAGAVVQTAYGVIQTSGNALLTGLYGAATGLTLVIQGVLKGLEMLYLASSKVTFGDVSRQYAAIAADLKIQSDGMGAAVDALGAKVRASMGGVVDGVGNAVGGVAKLTSTVGGASKATEDWEKTVADANAELEKGAEAAAKAGAAYQKKANDEQVATQAAALHRDSIATLRSEYDALIAAGNLQEAAKKFQEIEKAQRGVAKAADDSAAAIAAAYKDLGIVTDASLRETADRAKKNFDLLKASGTASAREIADGFADAAKKAIAANDGIAPSWVKAEAATRGYKVQVDEAGKATLEATKNAKAGLDDVVAGHRSAGAAAREQVGSVQALADAYTDAGAKALAAQGQFLAAAQAQKNADTSASSITNRKPSEQQFAWTRSTIIDYLKQAGLEDAVAQELSKQFLNGKGEVDYIANDAQKRWAGEYGTLAEALGKVAEHYKYDEGGQIEAQDIVDRAKRDKEIRDRQRNPNAPAPSPTPAPAPGPGTGTGTGGSTYINNITINGVGDWGMVRGQTRHTDADSAKTEVDLLRSLAQARGAAIQ